MSIEVEGISKTFGLQRALDDVTLAIPDGSLTALLGPSGCGKTTLLRIIAGLETPDAGRVRIQGTDVSQIQARARQVGFVFQHYALFKHMTVEQNIAFPLVIRRRPKAEIREVVDELIDLVHLRGHESRLPAQLSGGQRQRVALARALAARPGVLLLDEPFGALDATVRRDLRRWLRRLHQELRVTTAFVTHDQEEALEVADRIVVMRAGHVEQEGAPQEVLDHPVTPFVMNFLGNVNIFHGRVERGQALLGPLAVAYADHPDEEAVPAAGYARAHEFEVEETEGDGGGFWGTLTHATITGAVGRLEVVGPDGRHVQLEIPRERYEQLRPEVGRRYYVRPQRLRVFVDRAFP